MPESEMLPDDGTVIFYEDCDWFGLPISGSYANSPTGGRRKRPAELFAAGMLTPVLQSRSRTWTASEPVPAYSVGISIISDPWFQQLAFTDESTPPIDPVYFQTKWRLAWQPALAVGPGLPVGAFRPAGNSWSWIHLRYQMGEFDATYPLDYTAPVATHGATTHRWQHGIDAVPYDYEYLQYHTWPGTPWVETPLPPVGASLVGVTHLLPLIPQIGALEPSEDEFIPDYSAGLWPGGNRSRTLQLYPQFNGKTLV